MIDWPLARLCATAAAETGIVFGTDTHTHTYPANVHKQSNAIFKLLGCRAIGRLAVAAETFEGKKRERSGAGESERFSISNSLGQPPKLGA